MTIYRNMLVAVDLEAPEHEVLMKRVADWAKAPDTHLTILYVIPPVNFNVSASAEIIGLSSDEQLAAAARVKLADLTEKYGMAQVRCIVATGQPRQVIVAYAHEHAPDLIVTGNRGKHRLQTLLLGSTANTVLHQAGCDVLVIKLV